jgi:glycosyltransferase involved in cell wall biosynthesis
MKQSPLRVAMLIQRFSPFHGGAERQVEAVAASLQARDVQVCIITRRYPGLKSEEIIHGVPVFRMPIPGPKAAASLSYSLSALPVIHRWKPDVLHAHELLSPATTAVAAKSLFGMPVVATIHLGTDQGELAKLRRKFLGPQRLQLFRSRVDAFIAITHEIEDQLVKSRIPSNRCVYIPNGVDTELFQPVLQERKQEVRRRWNLPDGPLAIFVGRLVEVKRAGNLVDAWPQVRARIPKANLLVLGEGPMRGEWERRAGEGVRFLGDTADVAPFLQAADLFILPSVAEGLSVAILEAMACGLPILASDIPGNRECVEHQTTGWLTPIDDKPSLTGAILHIFMDPDLSGRMGRLGRERVLRDFSLRNAVDRQLQVYQKLRDAAGRRS